MTWISHYQLFLFDLDGLLVDTERLHYLAYKTMCGNRGIDFNWSFAKYCQAAHYDPNLFREQLLQEYPELAIQEPDWKVLYTEKQKLMTDFLSQGAAKLMPGVAQLLKILQKRNVKSCVVTHSPDQLVTVLRNQYEILNSIPFWITRKDYVHPKPDPECYQKAVLSYRELGDQVIGFEDTPRGIWALLGVDVTRVLVCSADYKEIPSFKEQGVKHFSSFEELLDLDNPL